MAITPFNPSNTALAAGDQKKKTGTGFTNLNRIMQANQGNKLGQAVGGGVAQQAGEAKTALNQARAGFDQQAQANRLDTNENKQKVIQTLQAVDQGQDVNDQTAQDFSRFRQGQYAGPQTLANEDQVLNQAQNAQNLGGLSSSAAGRQALLQRFVGGANYSQGKQRLDNLLLGQSGSQDLRDARRQTQNLNQQALQTADAARQQGQYLANQAKAFGNQVNTALGNQEAGYNTTVDQELAQAQSQEAAKSALFKQIQDALSANGQRTGAENLKTANDKYLENVNKALALASQHNILQDGDMARIGELNDALLTPAQQMLRQTTQGDNTAYLGYGRAQPGSTNVVAGDQIYSNLGLDEVLNNAFKTQAAQNLTRAGVATDADRQKLNAIAKLSGKTAAIGKDDPRYQAGGATFDLNQAGQDVDSEIARLKGDSMVDLPTIYAQTPWQQKLMNTIAPSSADAGQQVKDDIGGIFAGDSTVGDRAASVGKLMLDPYRVGLGTVAEQGAQLYNQTGEGLNNIFGKDASLAQRAQGIGQLANTGNNLATTAMNQGGNLVGSVPIVGGVAKDLTNAASSAVGNALSVPTSFEGLKNKMAAIYNPGSILGPAGNVIGKVASTVGNVLSNINPFCYAAGTPIKMKDGSYKNVEKIKLDDQLYYGGKVTALGQSKQENIHEYMGTRVTGSHAVFENGKFVRVEDSIHGKKLNTKEVVYPIECENHILVTKTHLGADFSEVKDSQGYTPEQRLEMLNSDKSRLKKLDTAVAVLFGKKEAK